METGRLVTTRVTYLFHCAIPLASRLLCETYPTLRHGPSGAAVAGVVRRMADGRLTAEQAQAELARLEVASERAERDRPADGGHRAGDQRDLMRLTVLTGARFKVLQAEASLPVMDARYEYGQGGR